MACLSPARLLSALVAVCLLCTSGATAQSPRPIRPSDIYRLKDVGSPRLSPDGAWIAYTVSTVDSSKDKSDSDIWMVSWDGTRTLRMTSSPEGESNPRWSPDNRFLSFVSGRYESKGGQIWLLDRSGGDAVRLTDLTGGVGEYEWSPDGTRIAIVSHDPDPDEGKPDSVRARNPKPIVIDRYGFKRDNTGYLNRLRDHLWIVDVATRTAVQITGGDFDDSSVRWSPDGRRLAFVSERANKDADRANNSDLYVIDAAKGASPMQLTTWGGPDASPVWSPDGTSIAYLQGSEPVLSAYTQSQIAVVPSAGGAGRLVSPTLDRDVSSLTWSADGTSLRFLLGDDRAVHLASVALAGGAVQRVLDGRRVVTSYDVSVAGRMVVSMGTAVRSPEIHALESGALRVLTHVNDGVFAELQLGTTEDLSFRNKDGLTVGALLVKPAGFTAGTKYPMVLRIHGGPNGQDQHLFSFERELFAASGYLVLAVNYRGSSGRGQAWKKAIFADW